MGYVYNDMERLRFWCQKVLPTVYDDSLSYYELLSKVVQYLNDTVENVNTLIQQVADIDADLSNVAIIQDSGMSTEYVWSSSYTNTKMNDKIHNSIINMRSAGSTGATYSCQYLTNNFAELENGKIKSAELPSDIVNTIEGIKVNGSTVNPDANKIVNLVVMTNAVDNLINYYTKTQTYTKSEVDTIASNIRNSRFEVVQTLPTTDIQTNVIYLVPKTSAGTQDGYNEYINLDGTTSGWELIGSTDIDLSGYVTTTDLNNALSNYVTTLTLTGILNNYITVSELATELASYATVSAMNTALAGKQNTLTFDNFPTAGSTNPVTSGGVKSATTEIWSVIGTIEAGLTSAHAYEVGDHIICWIGFAEVIAPIAVGDSLERNVNVVEGTIAEAVSDNLRGVLANTQLIEDTVGWTNKNKLPFTIEAIKAVNTIGTWNGNTYTYANGTFELQSADGINVSKIIANKPASTGDNPILYLPPFSLPKGNYILNGVPSGGSGTKYYCQYYANVDYPSGAGITDFGSGKEFTLTTTNVMQNGILSMRPNNVFTNLTFELMIVDANALDKSYAPHHSNVENTLRDAEVIEGKNKLDNKATSGTTNGTEHTVNDKKQITFKNTPSGNFGLAINTSLKLPADDYVLSGISGGSGSTYYLQGFGDIDYTSGSGIFVGNGSVEFTLTAENTITLSLYVRTGFDGTETTVSPMICTKKEWEKSHEYKPFFIPLKDRVRNVHTFTPSNTSITDCHGYYTINGKILTFVASYTKKGSSFTIGNIPNIELASGLGESSSDAFVVGKGASGKDVIFFNQNGNLIFQEKETTDQTDKSYVHATLLLK